MTTFQIPSLASLGCGIPSFGELEIPEARTIHLHPKDIGGAIVSFDQAIPPESWVWGGPSWESRGARFCTTITAVEFQSAHPDRMAENWSRVLGQKLVSAENQLRIPLEKSEIRFVYAVDGKGEGISAIEVEASDIDAILEAADRLKLPRTADRVTACGTDFVFNVLADATILL